MRNSEGLRLHTITAGNMLPSNVLFVVVDINPATVTKLSGRGSFQNIGVVTDVESFLRDLLETLESSDKAD